MLRIVLMLLIGFVPSVLVVAQDAPEETSSGVSQQQRLQLAGQCRALLKSSLIDFYFPGCVDEQHGGYHEVLDASGKFTGGGKFLTLQARHLWFFATLADRGIEREDSLSAAKSGYELLCNHFYDSEHGGYFTKTSHEGEPTDRRKHVYPNAFVIYAMVEYARATKSNEPLERAMKLFQTLEQHCYDKQYGGYNEFFHEDWKLVTDPNASGYIGAIGTKTYNSHLHLMEAFSPLYRETNDALVGKRLADLIQINTVTVKHPAWPCNLDGWNPDWSLIETPRNLRASYGHDVECAWLVRDATQALGRSDDPVRSWAVTICDHAIERGHDAKHGGFYYTGSVGEPSDDRKKEWWTQSEALVAMLTMYQWTGDPKYWTLFEETLDFVAKYHVAGQGGWWATVNPDGSPSSNLSRTSMWQGAYHNGRALLLCEQFLRTPKN